MSPMDTAELEAPAETTASESADCLCGVPNCKGHKIMHGIIEIPDHPHGRLWMRVPDDFYSR